MHINIRKASGELEPFSEEKVRSSLTRARIDKEVQNEIIERLLSGHLPSAVFLLEDNYLDVFSKEESEILMEEFEEILRDVNEPCESIPCARVGFRFVFKGREYEKVIWRSQKKTFP